MPTTTYTVPGSYTFTLPANADVNTPMTLDLKGAGGGQGDPAASAGRAAAGAGGRVVGTFDISAMTPGTSTIGVFVGGAGQSTPNTYTGSETQIVGGFNGGGSVNIEYGKNAGAGGGATDIRIAGVRRVVAGGGGGSGGGSFAAALGGTGGSGGPATAGAGQDTGANGAGGGGGGQAAAGGAGGAGLGGAPTGGNGGSGNGGSGALATGGLGGFASSGGAGGGGDWAGGGGGGAFSSSNTSVNGGGGGGGANYVGGLLAVSVNSLGGGSAQKVNGVASLTYNAIPNQPTLTPHANGDDTTGLEVTWTHSDPDPGDYMSNANIRWRVGAGAWTVVTTGAVVAGFATFTYRFAANAFLAYVGQQVEWQVRTYDTAGAVGAYSASGFTTIRREPTTTPTLTLPAPFNTRTPTVTVANTTQFRYSRVTMTTVSSGTLTDFGWHDHGAEVTSSSYVLPLFNYVNGQQYQFRVYTADYLDVPVQSPQSVNQTVTSAVDAPLQPSLSAVVDPNTASVTVTVVNPGSDPSPPVRNEVYRTDLGHAGAETRIALNVPVNGTFTDFQAPTNTQVQYRVAAVSAAGNRTFST